MTPRIARSLLLASTLLLCAPMASARDYDRQAKQAHESALGAITIFVDVDWGGREDGAARELTRAHEAFDARGYEVRDVEGFVENGDLQGFFVTYVRRR